jgi:hypothetical protein
MTLLSLPSKNHNCILEHLKCEPMQLACHCVLAPVVGNILLDLFLCVHMFCSPVARNELYI